MSGSLRCPTAALAPPRSRSRPAAVGARWRAVAVAAAAATVAAAAARRRRPPCASPCCWLPCWLSCWPGPAGRPAGPGPAGWSCWSRPLVLLARCPAGPAVLSWSRPARSRSWRPASACPAGCALARPLAASALLAVGSAARPGRRLGVARRACVAARSCCPAVAGVRSLRPVSAAGCARPASRPAPLAAALGGLDGVDQLGLLHGAGAAMPRPPAIDFRSASSMELSPPPRFFAGRSRLSGARWWIRWFPSREVLPTFSADPAGAGRRAGQCFLAVGAARSRASGTADCADEDPPRDEEDRARCGD